MIYNFKWIPVFTGMTICFFLFFPLFVLAETATFQGNVNIGANIKRDPTMPVPLPPEPISESISEIMINNGAKYTNSLDVVLYFFVKDAFQTMVNNKDNFYGIFWQPFQFTKEWKLASDEDGERTVYAKFKSVSGGFSEIVSDSIILDRTAPANVSDLTAAVDEKQIELKWKNPLNEDFKNVRILRSEKFFPDTPDAVEGSLPQSTSIVFDQKAESFFDVNAETGRTYYYTVFSYDYAGNFSSGALISAGLKSVSEITEKEISLIPPVKKEPFKIEKHPFEYLKKTPEEEISQSVKDLTLKDFDFFQEGKKIEFLGGNIVNIKPEIPLTILIDYEKLPEVLKTIIVTLEKPARNASSARNDSVSGRQAKRSDAGKPAGFQTSWNDKGNKSLLRTTFNTAHAAESSKYFSFLLRINSDKTAYQAKIAPPETGNYPLTIRTLDVRNSISKKISGILKVGNGKEKKQIDTSSLLTRFPFVSFVFLILIVIIGITQIPRIIRRHRYTQIDTDKYR